MKVKKTKEEITLLRTIVDDETKTEKERKDAALEIQDQWMNPKEDKDFNPETFDPMEGVPNYEIVKRNREDLPDELPTMGMKPKKLLEGQMIGMFESKQDLYLMMAHINNKLLARINALEQEVEQLKLK